MKNWENNWFAVRCSWYFEQGGKLHNTLSLTPWSSTYISTAKVCGLLLLVAYVLYACQACRLSSMALNNESEHISLATITASIITWSITQCNDQNSKRGPDDGFWSSRTAHPRSSRQVAEYLWKMLRLHGGLKADDRSCFNSVKA